MVQKATMESKTKGTMESKTKGTMWKSIENVSEAAVKSDPAFCLGSGIEKTNSGTCIPQTKWQKNFDEFSVILSKYLPKFWKKGRFLLS